MLIQWHTIIHQDSSRKSHFRDFQCCHIRDSVYQIHESTTFPREGPEVPVETWGYLLTVAGGLGSYILAHCSLNALPVVQVGLGVLGCPSTWHRNNYEQYLCSAESAVESTAQLWSYGYLHRDFTLRTHGEEVLVECFHCNIVRTYRR